MNLEAIRDAFRDQTEDRSVTDAKVRRYANLAGRHIFSAHDFSWTRREFAFKTLASETIVANTTNGSRKFSLASAATYPVWGATVISDNQVYRVESMVAVDGGWLDQPWRATGKTPDFKFIRDEIALPSGSKALASLALVDGEPSPTPIQHHSAFEARVRSLETPGKPAYAAAYRRSGIPRADIPVLAGTTGTVPAGTYTYWVSHWNPATLEEGPLSKPASHVLASPGGVTVTPEQIGDFFFKVYRSRKGEDEPYFLSFLNLRSTAYTDSDGTDDTLQIRAHNEGSQLFARLSPVPDAEYQGLGSAYVIPPDLRDDEDEWLFPESDSTVLLEGMRFYHLQATEEHEVALRQRSIFEAGIQRMIKRDRSTRPLTAMIGGGTRSRSRERSYKVVV